MSQKKQGHRVKKKKHHHKLVQKPSMVMNEMK